SRKSAPLPPSSLSLSMPPDRRSSPANPNSEALPAPASSVSSMFVPTSKSLLGVPLMDAMLDPFPTPTLPRGPADKGLSQTHQARPIRELPGDNCNAGGRGRPEGDHQPGRHLPGNEQQQRNGCDGEVGRRLDGA